MSAGCVGGLHGVMMVCLLFTSSGMAEGYIILKMGKHISVIVCLQPRAHNYYSEDSSASVS
jgi:hypothetical protein